MVVDVSVLSLKVDPSTLTIPEAIAIYVDAYNQQFANAHHQARKHRHLHRFLAHLIASQHSLFLADLTLADGQGFLDKLVKQDGTPFAPSVRQDHQSTLRTLSRFLFQLGLTATDVFSQFHVV
jgi:hypothetical protein